MAIEPQVAGQYSQAQLANLSQAEAEALRAGDVPNSKDSPIVSRFAGSTIVAYQQVNYDEVALPMGPHDNSGLRRRRLRPRGK